MSRDHYPFAQQFLSASNRRDDEADSEHGDHYSLNSSTTRLAGATPFSDHSGSYHHTSLPLFSQSPLHIAPADPSSDPYGRSYNPSVDSHSSIPSISPFADPGLGSSEHYPAWSPDRQIPMSAEEIEDIFLDLTQKFGFQRDSMRNMVSLTAFSLTSFSLIHLSVRFHHAPPRFSRFSHVSKSGPPHSPCRLHWRSTCKLP